MKLTSSLPGIILLLTSSASTLAVSPSLSNANHIFNSVNSALRQWGNSWNHNGMTLFRATVPADVLLYYGRGTNESVKGMQWLAFEAEHALMFARPARRRPHDGGEHGAERRPGREQGDRGPPRDGQHVMGDFEKSGKRPPPPPPHQRFGRESPDLHRAGQVDHDGPEDGEGSGYLQHYRTLCDLNLLYIDGQSAGKSNKGTLDTQDYLLLGGNSVTPDEPMDEMVRAVSLCNLTRTIWDGKIDGFVRMEGGFEILLCEFDGRMTLEKTEPVGDGWSRKDMSEEEKRMAAEEQGFRMYKAVSDRFAGIGGRRALINFDDLVTVYSRDDLNLFEKVAQTGEMLPRLRNVSESDLAELRGEVTRMVLSSAAEGGPDWQSISDMYVQRYAGPLQALLLSESEMVFRVRLEFLLRIFVTDFFKSEGAGEVIERCTVQFLPSKWDGSLAGRAVEGVAWRICGTLVNTLLNIITAEADHGETGKQRYTMVRQEVEDLVSWLDWPIWRYCSPGCAVDEVCVLPIWPLTGAVEDRKRPNCQNATTLSNAMGHNFGDNNYWCTPGDRHGPPGGPPPHGKPPGDPREENGRRGGFDLS